MLDKLLGYLRLEEDDFESESLIETGSSKSLAIVKTIIRSFAAILYLLAIIIQPIYITDAGKYYMRNIYHNIFSNVDWDKIVFVNMIVLVVIMVTEYIEEMSMKKNVKKISTVLSVVGLLVIGLIALPAPVYGRIALINGQKIEIGYGFVTILFLFSMEAIPILFRVVTEVNLWVFSIWCKNREEPSIRMHAIAYITELVIIVLVIRKIFVVAVSVSL